MEELTLATQPSVHLVARNPVEMQSAQKGLVDWLNAKITSVGTEMIEYSEAIEQATKNKWSRKGLNKAWNSAYWRQQFYEKTLAAVEAGYTIVPEFPIDIFAIRVERDSPEGGVRTSRYGRAVAQIETADIMGQGEGKYVSPQPKTTHYKDTRKDGDKEFTVDVCEPTALQAVEFPIRSARVEVMSATAEAMALNLFDEIGICPPSRKPDPLIIGRICLPRSDKCVSFLIAWHLNLNEL